MKELVYVSFERLWRIPPDDFHGIAFFMVRKYQACARIEYHVKDFNLPGWRILLWKDGVPLLTLTGEEEQERLSVVQSIAFCFFISRFMVRLGAPIPEEVLHPHIPARDLRRFADMLKMPLERTPVSPEPQ